MAGYALGDLSPEEAEAFQRLLAADAQLTAEVMRLQEVLALMPYALPEQEPPAHLRTAILEAAQQDMKSSASKTVAPIETRDHITRAGSRRSRISWKQIGGTIAAVLLAALAVDNLRLRRSVQQADAVIQALQQADAQIYALRGTEAAAAAAGTLIVNPDQQQMVIALRNLPELPTGQAYRLWAIVAGATQPAYCGQFNSPATGATLQWTAPEAVCSTAVNQMLITAESASAPPVPTGTLVMQSEL
jgi:anti-sigma-K factor RskA